jgi:hypothetical protein
MRPEAAARTVLSTTRARAKMHEFKIGPEFFNLLPRNPQMLFSLAVGILTDAAAAIADSITESSDLSSEEQLPPTWSAEDGSPEQLVRFSATFFDAYLEAKLDGALTEEFSILAASAYYLSDSVGSAAVVVKRIDQPPVDLANGLAALLYRILRNDFGRMGDVFPHSELGNTLLGALKAFFALEAESDAVIGVCRILRALAYGSGSDRELVYADLITACCARKMRNAARTLLPPSSGLTVEAWAPALAKSHFPIELWPAQRRLCEAGLLTGRSAVIQMPTSAGKTKATELVIRSAFLSGRAALAIIVAPFRALCHDIRGDLSKAFAGEEISLDEVSESYRFDVELETILAKNTVLIVTPEKLLFMLRQAPELAPRIGLIIYDEGHQFDGLARGPTYELLLATLRMTLAQEAQVLLISAVIGNASDVAAWLIRDPQAVVGGDGLLPTIKSIAFASWEHQLGQLRYVQPESPDEDEFFVPRVINQLPLAKFSQREKDRYFPERGTGESQEIGLFLGLSLFPNGSVALFCGQKTSVTKLCRRAIEVFRRDVALEPPISSGDVEEIRKLAGLIALHLGEDATSAEAAKLGFFGHHANTPHGIKLAIEHAMKEGHANFVICTSTLAQGVNFPLRYLIVTTTQQGRERIMVRDFHNLMGRAGRAGMHTEGSVIFSSPNIYDEKAVFNKSWRWTAAKDLLDPANSEPCRSSILDLFDDYVQRTPPIVLSLRAGWLDLAFADREQIDAIVANIVAAFPVVSTVEIRDFVRGRARAVQNIAAYLAEHVNFADENAMDRVEELAANTLAYHLADEATRQKLQEVFRATAKAIRDTTDEDFRLLIRRSPLPPSDLLELKAWFTDNLAALSAAREDGGLLELLYDQLAPKVTAKSLAAIPTRALALDTLRLWMEGQPYHIIFDMLAAVDMRVGGDRVTVEHVVDICEGGFGYDLAMILASAADLLSPLDEDLAHSVDTLHQWVKHGLDSGASIAFMDIGFADRVVAGRLGAAFPEAFDRSAARRICRIQDGVFDEILSDFPAYFGSVAAEIRTA